MNCDNWLDLEAGAAALPNGHDAHRAPSHHRPNIDQSSRCHLFGIANRHALLDDPFHAAQADAQFVLNQFAHRLDAPIAEVIDVIGRLDAVIDQNHAPDQADDVEFGDGAVRDRDVEIQLLIQLVAAHPFQIIVPLIEQLLFQERAGVLQGSRIARTHALEELDQGRLGDRQPARQVPGRLLLDGRRDVHPFGIGVDIRKQREDFLVRSAGQDLVAAIAVVNRRQGAQENGNRDRALTIELEGQVIRLAGLELHPGPAVGDEFGHCQGAAGGAVGGRFEIHTRGANQLRDDDAFRAVDDERPLVGHLGEIAQENVLLDRLGDFRPSQEHRNIQRAGIGQIPFDAFFNRMFRFSEPVFQVPLLGFGAAAGKMQAHALVV